MRTIVPNSKKRISAMEQYWQFAAIFGLLIGLMGAAAAQPVTLAAPLSRPSNLAAACVMLGRSSPEVARRLAAIPDAPTIVFSATVIPAGGNGNPIQKDYPEHCRIEGQIAPTIGFELRLPTQTWNGKFMMGGCGGPCGYFLSDRIDPALVRNYAVVVTDMGHKGQGWMFADNNIQGMIDFGYRSTHVTAVAAKEIINEFYGTRASRNYFNGCSTGGRQGLVEAQRYPDDFDGIVAGAPPWKQTGHQPYASYWPAYANMKDGKPILDRSKLPMLHKAVLAKCDAADGLADGIIQNPLACNFKPSDIACKRGEALGNCLTNEEAAVVAKIYQGPVTSKGILLHRGQAKGSELNWTAFLGDNGNPGAAYDPIDSTLHHLAFLPSPGPTYRVQQFDFDRDPPRLASNDAFFNHTNPDLGRLKANGGKLILFHGWNDDNGIPPELAIDYYKMVEQTMGGWEQTQDFLRLFMMPAMNHCRGGIGGGEIDWISAIENWVERGSPPEQVIVHHLAGDYIRAGGQMRLGRHPLHAMEYDRSRPVYAYPGIARYRGSGDPALPASWMRDSSTDK